MTELSVHGLTRFFFATGVRPRRTRGARARARLHNDPRERVRGTDHSARRAHPGANARVARSIASVAPAVRHDDYRRSLGAWREKELERGRLHVGRDEGGGRSPRGKVAGVGKPGSHRLRHLFVFLGLRLLLIWQLRRRLVVNRATQGRRVCRKHHQAFRPILPPFRQLLWDMFKAIVQAYLQ